MSKEKSAASAEYPETSPRDDHPLFAREIRSIRTWQEWCERWEKAETVEEMLGLLHAGFETEVTEKRASYPRVVFYLGIADGWSDYSLLKTPAKESHENRYTLEKYLEERTATSKRRQAVARKAFDMLCLHFFKGYKEPLLSNCRDDYREWQLRHDVAEKLLRDLQNFFRIEKSLYSDKIIVRNCPRHETQPHNAEHAVEFLKNLAIFVLDWEDLGYTQYCKEDERKELDARIDAMNAQMNAAKPWAVEVLSYLGALEDLLVVRNGFDSDKQRKRALALPKSCLGNLTEIALRARMNNGVAGTRQVKTLEEALYAGSTAARLVTEIEIVRAQHDRLKKILDAEHKKAAAERDLQNLTGRKK